MDFNDTAEEAAYRAQVKSWLSARTRRRPGAAMPRTSEKPRRA